MKQTFILCLLIVIACFHSQAQKGISGKIQDTTNVRSVVYATVSVIQKSDSILVKSVRSSQQGTFSISPLQNGTYFILVAHSQFIDYIDEFVISDEHPNKNFGTIPLTNRGHFLKEVVIKNLAGIKIKGDTLEYLADSFKVKQGAMVEDLLKVLPGIQVNAKGEITAMGEKVEKVLVDGEEFFGDDPTVATQNIRSTVVEKVQVFDKKSDQAQFTGFDDGNEEKTINLKLKDNMNHGEFGKVILGAGPNDRWQNEAMINSFKNKRQFSLYGIMSSNGKTGLGWEDKNKYTDQGSSFGFDEDGGWIWNSNDDEDDFSSWGNRTPEGITKSWIGGTHYANKWLDGKHHVNTNYTFGRINKTKRENSYAENILPTRTFSTQDTSHSFSSKNTHKLTGLYEFAPDSLWQIIYRVSARLSFDDNNSYSATENINDEYFVMNQSTNNYTSDATSRKINNTLTINKKLNKVGRTVSLNTIFNNSENDGKGFLKGENNYFVDSLTIQDVLDQKKVQEQKTQYLNAELTFTEQLQKKLMLKTSIGVSSNASNAKKYTYTQNNNDEYLNQIDSLSSHFDSKVFSQTLGAEIKYREKKYSVTLGSKLSYSLFDQHDFIRNRNYNYNRLNVFPTLRFNYKFGQASRLSINYNGSTTQPSIQQLQPIQDNSNPLNIVIGNPDLKIGYQQNIQSNYFNYKIMTGRSMYLGASIGNYFNNVSLNTTVDELGRTISQYVNLKGGGNINAWGGYHTKIPKSNFTAKLDMNVGYRNTPIIVNNIKGTNTSSNISITPGIGYNKENVMDGNIGIEFDYNSSKNSLLPSRNLQYINVNPTFELNVYPTKKSALSTDFNYLYQPPIGPFTKPFNRFVWNAAASYRFLKSNNLELELAINDILNQNKGYQRTTNNNYNSERYFMTLGRYAMLSLKWNFSTGPMAKQNDNSNRRRGGGHRVMRR
ncbi:MAG: TonB-dependent receptor [Chitinophagaceae bacterium]